MKNLTHHFTALPLYSIKSIFLVILFSFGILFPPVNAQTNSCCTNGLVMNGGSLSSWLSTVGITGNTLSGTCLRITQTMEVDIDFSFENMEIWCSPGVKIFVNPTISLNIEGSRLDACTLEGQNQMWHGIQGAFTTITIRDSKISNAFVAVYSNFSLLDVSNVEFNNNYVGMDLIAAQGIPQFINLHSLEFKCYGSLLNHYVGAISNPSFLFPFNIDKSYIGIRATGFSNLQIGSSALANPNIEIYHHHYGIELFNCIGPKIKNTLIGNVENYSPTVFPNTASLAIWGWNCTDQIEISNSEIIKSDNGIYCEQSALSLGESNIEVHIAGVTVLSPPSATYIANNSIEAGRIGVNINTCTEGGYITGNSIISKNRNAVLLEYSNNFDISNNPIIEGGTNALWLNSVQNSTVTDNTSLQSNGRGLGLSNCQFVYVADNQMQSSDFGISAIGAENVTYCNNVLFENGIGLEFSPSCVHTSLKGTQFVDNVDVGLKVDEDALLTEQLFHANSWTNETATTDGVYLGTNQTKIFANLFAEQQARFPMGNINNLTLSIDPSLPDWFLTGTLAESSCANSGGGSSALVSGSWETDKNPNSTDLFIANQEINILSEEAKAIAWMQKQYLYKIVDNNSQYLSDPDLAYFHARHTESALGQLAEIDYGISGLFQTPLAFQNLQTSLKEDLEELQEQLDENYDALHLAASIQEYLTIKNARVNLLEQYELIVSNYVNVLADIEAAQHIKTDILLLANNEIAVNDTWEANEKTLNGFYLRYIGKGKNDYSESDKTIVESIANQCLEEGGRSIFRARALVRLWDSDFEAFCIESNSRENIKQEVSITQKEVLIFPHPAENNINFKIANNRSDVRLIRLLNAQGKIVFEQNKANSTTNRIALNNCPSGIYSLVIVFEDGSSNIQNVVVQK